MRKWVCTPMAKKSVAKKKPANRRAPPKKKSSAKGKTLKPGTKVKWTSSQGTIRGVVKKKVTKPMKIKKHQVSASPNNPEYLVESEKTGAQAAHKAEALQKT